MGQMILQILGQLGANKTVFIQFVVFGLSITALTLLVFNPFYKALDQRLEKTKGADNVAKETVDEARLLETVYRQKAREINDKIKSIFDEQKNSAQQVATNNLSIAKQEAEVLTQKTKKQIEEETTKAKSQMGSLTSELVGELSKKFEGGM